MQVPDVDVVRPTVDYHLRPLLEQKIERRVMAKAGGSPSFSKDGEPACARVAAAGGAAAAGAAATCCNVVVRCSSEAAALSQRTRRRPPSALRQKSETSDGLLFALDMVLYNVASDCSGGQQEQRKPEPAGLEMDPLVASPGG